MRELDEAGIPQGAPRAYRVPFTEQAAEEAQAALGKMEEGDVMNGTLSNNAMREKDKEAQRESDYEGTDRMGGDDGFRPMFELREVPPPPAIESIASTLARAVAKPIERTPDCPVFFVQ